MIKESWWAAAFNDRIWIDFMPTLQSNDIGVNTSPFWEVFVWPGNPNKKNRRIYKHTYRVSQVGIFLAGYNDTTRAWLIFQMQGQEDLQKSTQMGFFATESFKNISTAYCVHGVGKGFLFSYF